MNAVTPLHASTDTARLPACVGDLAAVLAADEPAIPDRGAGLLRALIATDDWLPEAFAQHEPGRYQQHLLHCDSRERFPIVSFACDPGQATPIHDHRVCGLVGQLTRDGTLGFLVI